MPNGFNEVESGANGFGYGVTFKRKRFIHEYTFNILFSRKMESDNKEEVKVSGFNIPNCIFGFDLLKTPRVNLFPFIGINYQNTSLQYKRSNPTGTYGSLFDIPPDVDNFTIQKEMFRFTVGGEFDYHAVYQDRSGGLILGIRYGINTTLAESTYKAEKKKIDYDPEISLRDSYVTFMLKFYMRRQYKVR